MTKIIIDKGRFMQLKKTIYRYEKLFNAFALVADDLLARTPLSDSATKKVTKLRDIARRYAPEKKEQKKNEKS